VSAQVAIAIPVDQSNGIAETSAPEDSQTDPAPIDYSAPVPVFSQECLDGEVTSILDSIRREIGVLNNHNAEIEKARRAQGVFQYVVNGLIYSGPSVKDPFQTQISFNKQRIQTLEFALQSFGAKAKSLAARLGKDYDLQTALELFDVLNTLRRIKGIPEITPDCQPAVDTFTSHGGPLFVSPEQFDEHQEAISLSKDVSVAVITTAGGLVTVPLSGGAAAGAITPLITSALAGCVENGVVEWSEGRMDEWRDSSGRVLSEDEIISRVVAGCGLGAVFTAGGAAAARKALKILGGSKVKALIKAGRAQKRSRGKS
jgi:hypothetical protein